MQLAFRTPKRHFWMRIAPVKSPFLVLTHQSSQPYETIFFSRDLGADPNICLQLRRLVGCPRRSSLLAACVNITLSIQDLKLAAKAGMREDPAAPLSLFLLLFFFPALPLFITTSPRGGVCVKGNLAQFNGDARLQRGDSLTSGGSKARGRLLEK